MTHHRFLSPILGIAFLLIAFFAAPSLAVAIEEGVALDAVGVSVLPDADSADAAGSASSVNSIDATDPADDANAQGAGNAPSGSNSEDPANALNATGAMDELSTEDSGNELQPAPVAPDAEFSINGDEGEPSLDQNDGPAFSGLGDGGQDDGGASVPEENPIVMWNGIYRATTSVEDAMAGAVLIRIGGSSLVIDPAKGATAAGTRVQSWASNDTINQRFTIVNLGGGYVRLVGIKSGLALSSLGTAKEGAAIALAKISSDSRQKWRVVFDKTKDTFKFVSAANGKLAIGGGTTKGKGLVLVKSSAGSCSMKVYRPVPIVSKGTYSLANGSRSYLAVDITNGKVANKTNIQAWNVNPTNAQRFRLEWNDSVGYYRIVANANPAFVLDVANGGTSSGTNVWLYKKNGTPAQWWTVRLLSGGHGYAISSSLSGLQLGAKAGAPASGSNLVVLKPTSAAARGWLFKECSLYNYPALSSSDDLAALLARERAAAGVWNGIYRAASSVKDAMAGAVLIRIGGSSLVIDPAKGARKVGTRVQSWVSNDTINQRFTIVNLGGGYVRLVGIKSGLALSSTGTAKEGSSIALSKVSSDSRQKWKMTFDKAKGTFRFVSAANGKLALGGGTKKGTGLALVKSSAGSSSMKVYRPTPAVPDGSYVLANKSKTTIAVDIAGGKMTNKTNVQAWNVNPSNVQRFRLEWNDSVGYYRIAADANPAFVLDVANGGTSNGTNVWLYKKNGTPAQWWTLRLFSDARGHSISSSLSGLQLGAKAGTPASGSNLVVLKPTTAAARGWLLVRDSPKANETSPSTKLSIPTSWYGGSDKYEAYHPKVIAFGTEWNGYQYWMAYTPYPAGKSAFENPCICASNDLVTWEVPQGLANPIDDIHADNNDSVYNSDTHLLYNPDTQRLELFWRRVDYDEWCIYRSVSEDGIHWSDKEVVLNYWGVAVADALSPVVMYENGRYRMWYVTNRHGDLYYTESEDCLSWTAAHRLTIPYAYASLGTWHLDIEKTPNGYEALLSACDDGNTHIRMSLWHSVSADGICNWSTPTEILQPLTGMQAWDNLGIYRSCLLVQDGIYYVFYSALSSSNVHGVGLATGTSVDSLERYVSC